MEKLENSSVPTHTPAGGQHMDRHEEDRQHTVGKTNAGRNMSTQTPVVHHSSRQTQTEEQQEPGVSCSDAEESQPEEEKQKNPDRDSAQPPARKMDSDGESPDPAENLSEGTSCDRSQMQSDDRKTYADAVTAKSGSKRKADTETSEAKDKLPEAPQTLQSV